MNDYSSLFTSGLMLLCDSARPRSCLAPESPADEVLGMRSFLSLDMAESLRTLSSPTSTSHRRSKQVTPAASSSKDGKPRSPMSRRRSLPQPKPAPLAELPVVPSAHSRSRSDSGASTTLPEVSVIPTESDPSSSKGKAVARREHLAPITSSLKLELSSAPTTPGSRFPTTPTSSRAMSMFSPMTPPSADQSWFPSTSMDPTSPADTWSDPFAGALSPTTAEGVLGLHFGPNGDLSVLLEGGENLAPLPGAPVPKRARARRGHTAPSRNNSTTNSMRSSQVSVTTSYRKAQRGGALARLEGRIPRSEWMSDEEEGESVKYKPALSLMPSMDSVPSRKSVRRPEDQNFSFMDLTDDVASLVARSGFA